MGPEAMEGEAREEGEGAEEEAGVEEGRMEGEARAEEIGEEGGAMERSTDGDDGVGEETNESAFTAVGSTSFLMLGGGEGAAGAELPKRRGRDLWSTAGDDGARISEEAKLHGLTWEDVAERTFQATKVVGDDGEPYGMLDFGLSAYGSGITIYFSSLLYLAVVYLVAGLIALGMTVVASREGEREVSGEAEWTVDSVGPGLWRWEDSTFGSGGTVAPDFVWINVAWTLVLFFLLLILKRWTMVECQRIDEKWVTDGDYTIAIQGLPVTSDGKPGFEISELVDYLTEVPVRTNGVRDCCSRSKVVPGEEGSGPLRVYQVIPIYNVTDVIQLADEHAMDVVAARGAQNRLAEAREMGKPAKAVKEIEDEVVATDKECGQSLALLIEEGNKEPEFTGTVYVIFEKSEDADRFSHLFRLDTLFKIFIWLLPASDPNDPERFSFKGNKLVTEWAPEPNDIIWVNHSLPERVRRTRMALSWLLVTFPLVALSTFFQLWLDSIDSAESQAIYAAKVVAIMFVNGCIVVLLLMTSGFERPPTFSVEGTSRAYKLFVAQFLNMTIPPMVLYYANGKATRELASFALFLLIGEGFRTVLFDTAYTAVAFYGSRWWGRNYADTQQEMCEWYEGTFFDLGSQFTQVLKVGLLSLFYAPVCPSILLVASGSFVVNHFADKWCLLHWSAPPPSYNAILPVLNLYMLFGGLAFHSFLAGLLFYHAEGPAALTLIALGGLYAYFTFFVFHVWPNHATRGLFSALGSVLRACLPGCACATSCGPQDDGSENAPQPHYSALVESLGQGRKRGPQVPPEDVMPEVATNEKWQQRSDGMRTAILSRFGGILDRAEAGMNQTRAALKKIHRHSTNGVVTDKRRSRMLNAMQWRCQGARGAHIQGYRWNDFVDCDSTVLSGTKALERVHPVTVEPMAKLVTP